MGSSGPNGEDPSDRDNTGSGTSTSGGNLGSAKNGPNVGSSTNRTGLFDWDWLIMYIKNLFDRDWLILYIKDILDIITGYFL